MSIEDSSFRKLGIRRESPNTSLLAVRIAMRLTDEYAKRSHLKVTGSLPAEGGALIFSNHVSMLDSLRGYYTGFHAIESDSEEPTWGRVIRGVVKSTLVGIPEPEAVRRKTGKNDFFNSSNPFAIVARRLFVTPFLTGLEVIPIVRGTIDHNGMDKIIGAVTEEERLVPISLIPSRDSTGGLKDLGIGPAMIMDRLMQKDLGNTAVYFTAIDPETNTINISPHTSVAGITGGVRVDIKDLTMTLADELMALQPPSITEKWRLEGRSAEYDKLFNRKKSASS